MKARKAALALVLSGLLLGLLELAARQIPEPPQLERGIVLDPHPTRIWSLSAPAPSPYHPALYSVDADGMRSSAWEGTPDAPLILTLGDSSIFGDGILDEAALHAQLGQDLHGLGVEARTQTVAVPGYSLVQTTVVMEELGWARDPDLLLVGNLWSDCSLDSWRDEELLAAARSPFAMTERLLDHSTFFRRLRGLLNSALHRPATRTVTWPTAASQGIRRVPLAQYATLLQALLDEAAARGVGAIVLTLADQGALSAGQFVGTCAPYAEVQTEIARGRGLPVVSALQVYQASGLSIRGLLHDGLHPNAQGVALLASAVARSLVDGGWPAARLVPGPAIHPTLPADPWDGAVPPMRGSVLQEVSNR